MLMTDEDLALIEHRADLYVNFGARDALRAEDVTRMLEEIREARSTVAHLVAELRQAQAWGWSP